MVWLVSQGQETSKIGRLETCEWFYRSGRSVREHPFQKRCSVTRWQDDLPRDYQPVSLPGPQCLSNGSVKKGAILVGMETMHLTNRMSCLSPRLTYWPLATANAECPTLLVFVNDIEPSVGYNTWRTSASCLVAGRFHQTSSALEVVIQIICKFISGNVFCLRADIDFWV